jgi:hypothetical protein
MGMKALVTFGVGRYAPLLDISRPLFRQYAERHGYEYIELVNVPATRPLSWMKLEPLARALETYDAVLWLGADVVIVDGSEDIGSQVAPDAWQGMVAHHVSEGEVPNCDVWYLHPPMAPILKQAWEMTGFINHPWWEQAAIMHLMGYDLGKLPIKCTTPTDLYRHTHFLPLAWNSHESSDRAAEPRFVHATYGPVDWRLDVMRRYAGVAV